jgi:hypothetical protein
MAHHHVADAADGRAAEPRGVGEHVLVRAGALAYLAAWDVHQARLFGRCERKTGIVPFGRLVAQIMRQQPYRSARHVF